MPTKLTPKWQVVENIAAALERVRNDTGLWKVTQNAMVPQRNSKKRRQVDVWVECTSGSRVFTIAIDVKNESKPLDIETAEQLSSKGRKLLADRYVVVSTSGFTEEAREECVRCGLEVATLSEFDALDVIRINALSIMTPDIKDVQLGFHSESRPPIDGIRDAWLVGAYAATQLHSFISDYARGQIASRMALADEPIKTLILNASRIWKGVRVGDVVASPPFCIDITWSLDLQTITGTGINLRYLDGSDMPDLQDPNDAILVQESLDVNLVKYVLNALDVAFQLEKLDTGCVPNPLSVYNWHSMRVQGHEWRDLVSILIDWRIRLEESFGKKFKTEEGNEVFATLVPTAAGVNQQITFVTIPQEDGSSKLTLAWGPANSKRSYVKANRH